MNSLLMGSYEGGPVNIRSKRAVASVLRLVRPGDNAGDKLLDTGGLCRTWTRPGFALPQGRPQRLREACPFPAEQGLSPYGARGARCEPTHSCSPVANNFFTCPVDKTSEDILKVPQSVIGR